MLLGKLPVPEVTADELRASAQAALTNLRPIPDYIAKSLLEYGRERLELNARLICTDVWPLVFHILCLDGRDPITAWRLPKTEAVPLLPESNAVRESAQTFLTIVRATYASPFTAERYIGVLAAGIAFRETALAWYATR